MQLNQFNGGLNTRAAPYLVQQTEGVVYENIDILSGALKPMLDDLDMATTAGKNLYNFNNTWLYSNTDRSYVEFLNNLYFSDGSGKVGFTSDGITIHNSGIPTPAEGSATLTSGNYSYGPYATKYSVITGNTNMTTFLLRHHKFGDQQYCGVNSKHQLFFTGSDSTAAISLYSLDGTTKIKDVQSFSTTALVSSSITDNHILVYVHGENIARLYTADGDYLSLCAVYDSSSVTNICISLVGDNIIIFEHTSNMAIYAYKITDNTIGQKTLMHSLGSESTCRYISGAGNYVTVFTYHHTSGNNYCYTFNINNYAAIAYENHWQEAGVLLTSAVNADGRIINIYNSGTLIVRQFGTASAAVTVPDTNVSQLLAGTRSYVSGAYFYTPSTATRFDMREFTAGNVQGWITLINGMLDSNYMKCLNCSSVGDRLQGFTIHHNGFLLAGTVETWLAKYIMDAPDTITYTYTYYNSITYIESSAAEAFEFAAATSVVCPKLTASNIPEDVDTVRLYMYIAGVPLLAAEATVVSNTAIVYDVATYDDLITALPAISSTPAPTGLVNLTEHSTMLFGSVGSALRYTDIGLPASWSEFYSIPFEGVITGAGSTANGLLVFTKYKTYIIVGNDPGGLSKYLLNPSQGCVSHRSIQFVNNTLVWVSTDGICASTGGEIKVMSRDKLGKLSYQESDILGSIVFDERYYLVLTDKILVGDFSLGALVFYTIDVQCESIAVYNDDLYYSKASKLYKLNGSTVYKNVHYKSGYLAEGSLSNVKNYKDIYVYSEYSDGATLKVYINSTLVGTYILTAGFNDIKLPQGKQRGYYIEFEIEGKAIINEIEYKVEARQNGK